MTKDNYMESVERYGIVNISMKDSSLMESCQGMAETSGMIGSILETGKMTDTMAKEH